MTSVVCTICNLRAVRTKTVYAFLDANLEIDGVSIRIAGIQARHLSGGGTSVHLPCYRDIDGKWRAAVQLPQEVSDGVSAAVLEFLVEEGVAKGRDTVGDEIPVS